MSRIHRIDELAHVEFEGSLAEAFYLYAVRLHDLALRWQLEADLAATDMRAALEALHGSPLLAGLNVYFKARRVAKRAQRIAELAHGLAAEAEQIHFAYMKHIYQHLQN